MSDNKFIARLKGEKAEKTVVEVKTTQFTQPFTDMPTGSNIELTIFDDKDSAVIVAKGSQNWLLNNAVLQSATPDFTGNGSDFISEKAVAGSTLWVNASYTFPEVVAGSNVSLIFGASSKWVLRLCGKNLMNTDGEEVHFTLIIKVGNTEMANKQITVARQAGLFCKQLAIDFSESEKDTIKGLVGETLTVQLLCADANASAVLYNGMTVLTLLNRKIDASAVSSETVDFQDIPAELADLSDRIQQNTDDIGVLETEVADLQTNKADKTDDFETPITPTNKGATMKEIEEVQTTSIVFKGYVSTTEPDSATYALIQGNLWINSATMPTVFPVPQASIKVWDGSAWQPATEDYSPKILDAWSNLNNNEGYYWFGAWKVFSTDLSPDFFVLNQTSGQYEIKDLSIGTQQITDGAITVGKLADNAVETAKIKDSAVETAKIANGAITAEKLAGQPSFSGKAGSAVFVNSTANGFEFKPLSDTLVDLSSAQTITGSKTFTQPILSSNVGRGFAKVDSNGVLISSFGGLGSGNAKETFMYVYNEDGTINTYLSLYYNDGQPYALVGPTYNLAVSDNSNKLASTAFVNSFLESKKANIINWGLPDYTNGVPVESLPFTAPKDGVLMGAWFASGDYGTLKISTAPEANFRIGGTENNAGAFTIVLTQGESLSNTGAGALITGAKTYFYPFKGA